MKTKRKKNADATTLAAVLPQRCSEVLAFLCTTSESKRKFSVSAYWMQSASVACARVQTQRFPSLCTTEPLWWETDASPVDCHLLRGWHVPVTQGVPLVMSWTPDPSTSASWVLRLQTCPTTAVWSLAGEPTQGVMHALNKRSTC